MIARIQMRQQIDPTWAAERQAPGVKAAHGQRTTWGTSWHAVDSRQGD